MFLSVDVLPLRRDKISLPRRGLNALRGGLEMVRVDRIAGMNERTALSGFVQLVDYSSKAWPKGKLPTVKESKA